MSLVELCRPGAVATIRCFLLLNSYTTGLSAVGDGISAGRLLQNAFGGQSILRMKSVFR